MENIAAAKIQKTTITSTQKKCRILDLLSSSTSSSSTSSEIKYFPPPVPSILDISFGGGDSSAQDSGSNAGVKLLNLLQGSKGFPEHKQSGNDNSSSSRTGKIANTANDAESPSLSSQKISTNQDSAAKLKNLLTRPSASVSITNIDILY